MTPPSPSEPVIVESTPMRDDEPTLKMLLPDGEAAADGVSADGEPSADERR